MNTNKWNSILLTFAVSVSITVTSYALPYNIVPKAGFSLPEQIIIGNTATAYYTVTNATSRILPGSHVKYLPPFVTQVTVDNNTPDLCGASFTLSPGASCTLELAVSGAVNPVDPNPHNHLFVCSPNVPARAGTPYPLNVKAITPTISGIVQSGNSSAEPLANANVTIYRADLTHATPIGDAITDSSGRFYIYIPPEKSAGATSFYAIARQGNNTKLATIIGKSIISSITINELTTVGAVFLWRNSYTMVKFMVNHWVCKSLLA